MNGRNRGLPHSTSCASLETLLSVLAGGRRLEITRQLATQRMPVTTLADSLDLGLSLVSHNLRTMRDYGMVEATRHGTTHVYGLSSRVTAIRSDSHLYLSAIIEKTGEFMLLGCRSNEELTGAPDNHSSAPGHSNQQSLKLNALVTDIIEIMRINPSQRREKMILPSHVAAKKAK